MLSALSFNAVEWHYTKLVAPLVGGLYQEIMILGILLVAFGILRRLAQERDQFRNATVYQRLLIVLVAMAFTANVIFSYDLYGEGLGATAYPLRGSDVEIFSAVTLAMVPLELLTALALSAVYGVLAFRDYRSDDRKSPPGLQTELLILFGLLTAFHLLNTLWYVVMYVATERGAALPIALQVAFGAMLGGDVENAPPPAADLHFHLSCALIYLAMGVAWGAVSTITRRPVLRPLWDWVGTLGFVAMMLSVYVARLGGYLESVKG